MSDEGLISVGQLIEKLSTLPQDATVFVTTQCCGCFEQASEIDKRLERGIIAIGGDKYAKQWTDDPQG